MKQRAYAAIGAILVVIGSVWTVTFPSGTNKHKIYDVSWPNCQVKPPASSSAIIGVTGGLDFRPNPCLNEEAGWFNQTSLYINTGYPGVGYGKRLGLLPRACNPNDKLCWAYNYGYSATLYAINYADTQAVHATFWWLDVETDNSWTNSVNQNRASLEGALAAIKQNVFLGKVGLYSYPAQWQIITGNWRISIPNWVATGSSSPALAKSYCSGNSFSGGPTWLTQYTQDLDIDYLCNNSFYTTQN